jgi:alkylhydroperoxidase family enzyme
VSAANGCAYRTAAHSTFAAGLRAAPEALAAARGIGHAADARTDALIAFTHAVVRERGHVGGDALARYLAAGFTPAQAMEVAADVGLKTIGNYIDGFADIALDDAVAPERWAPTDDSAH